MYRYILCHMVSSTCMNLISLFVGHYYSVLMADSLQMVGIYVCGISFDRSYEDNLSSLLIVFITWDLLQS